jgi:EAL domain-containing protein (putative c-di-GMP-specific phosphodiesterase class I)
LFVGVEMRGSGRMFNDFTLVLDQIFLRAFKSLDLAAENFSININVETVFTKVFENFLDEAPRDLLSKIFFEFRQPNIVEHFDEFEVARGLIKSKGARIAVDRIFPDTLGLVDLDYLGASIAKVHWRAGAGETLQARAKAIKYITECGVTPVLIRVDDHQALDVGAELGVDTFQGFLIDDMMKARAA